MPAEDYQEFVTQSQPETCDYEFGLELNVCEDNYSLATSGEITLKAYFVSCGEVVLRHPLYRGCWRVHHM
jgi:hypothetical protein